MLHDIHYVLNSWWEGPYRMKTTEVCLKMLKNWKIAFWGEFLWFLGEFLTILGGIFHLFFREGGWKLIYFGKKKKLPPWYGQERVEKAENCIFWGILVIFEGNFDNFGGNFPSNFHGRGMGVDIFWKEKKYPLHMAQKGLTRLKMAFLGEFWWFWGEIFPNCFWEGPIFYHTYCR